MVQNLAKQKLFDLYSFRIYPALYCRFRWMVSPFREMEKFIPKEGIIYDIGCGEGVFANYLSLKSEKRKVIGIEILRKKYEVAKTTENTSGGGATFLNANILNKETIMLNCEGIVLSDVLHHLDYKFHRDLLVKVCSRLKYGGVLLIRDVDSNYFSYRFWCNFILENLLYPSEKYYFLRKDELISLLTEIGLNVEHILANEGLPFSNNLYICRKKGK